MGVIVAAPTAGSCGCLPGSVIGAARALGMGPRGNYARDARGGARRNIHRRGRDFRRRGRRLPGRVRRGLSGMAAAALVQLAGGSARQCVDAASMAIQNIYGPRLRPGREPRRSPLPRQKRHGRLERPLLRQHGARRLRQGNPARRDDSGDVRRRHEAPARTALHLRRPRQSADRGENRRTPRARGKISARQAARIKLKAARTRAAFGVFLRRRAESPSGGAALQIFLLPENHERILHCRCASVTLAKACLYLKFL